MAGLSVLIRFLSYLDARIRLEGWEVDLAVRAEAQRQFGDATVPASNSPPAAGRSRAAVAAPLLLVIMLWQAPQALAAFPAQLPWPVALAQQTTDLPTDGPAIPLPEATPWYDDQQRELRPVPVKIKTPEAEHRHSRWEPAPPKPKAVTPPAIGGIDSYRIFGWILLAGFAFALIALLFYLVGKIEPEVLETRQTRYGIGAG